MSPIVVREPDALLDYLEDIRQLADTERNSLGFLPAQAYEDAARRRRLFALVDSNAPESPVLGSIVFSGVYPQAKIQQIVVRSDMRRRGFGSTLLRFLLSLLEERGFLEVRADIANDPISLCTVLCVAQVHLPAAVSRGRDCRPGYIGLYAPIGQSITVRCRNRHGIRCYVGFERWIETETPKFGTAICY